VVGAEGNATQQSRVPTITTLDESEAERVHWLGPEEPPLVEEVGT